MQKHWTARDLPDLSGKLVLVTGANGGLGLETCRALAAHGAHVVMACRNADKAAAAAADIRSRQADAELETLALDLADLASIRSAAESFTSAHARLDVLVNNAGIIGQPRRQTKDGFELQIGVDFLGHFALTGLLLDTLRHSPAARVVSVGSCGWMHRFAHIHLDDLNWEQHRYRGVLATGQAKLALQIFSIELQRRLAARGESTISVAAHPGVANTNVALAGYAARGATVRKALMHAANVAFAQSAAQGALPTLYAAAAAGVQGGDFYGPDGLLELRGHPRPVKAAANARDPHIAAELWARAETLTGVHFLS